MNTPNIKEVFIVPCATMMRAPSPLLAPTYSATIAPTMLNTIATRSPAKTYGRATQNLSFTKTCQRDAFFATNELFHIRLLQMSGNRWLEQTVHDLRKVMKLNRHHSLFRQGRLTESLTEHREVMQVGPMRAEIETQEERQVPPIAAGLVLAAGVALLVMGRKK